jgi:sec-independent protein translocase protein TatB
VLDLGFFEILLIGIVAVIVLGPEKLPEAMAKVFKFFRKAKNLVMGIKDSIDKELQIEELKEEANRYKSDLMSAQQQLNDLANRDIANPINSEIRDMKKVESETKKEVTLRKDSAKLELKQLLNGGDKKDV